MLIHSVFLWFYEAGLITITAVLQVKEMRPER